MGCITTKKENSRSQVYQNARMDSQNNQQNTRPKHNQIILGGYYLSQDNPQGYNQETNLPLASGVYNQGQEKQQGGKLYPHTIANQVKDLKESFENSLKKSEYSNKSAQQNVVKQHSHSSSENQPDYQNVQVGNNKQG